MFEDFAKDIKAQLYERVRSPLLGAFAFSWVLWNHRLIMAFFSEMKFAEKIAYFDDIYPTLYDFWICGVVPPLLFALGYIFLYPYPARWIYNYSARQDIRLKEARNKIEDITPLSQEQAKALRKLMSNQAIEHQKEIQELDQLNQELKRQLSLSAQQAANQVPRSEALKEILDWPDDNKAGRSPDQENSTKKSEGRVKLSDSLPEDVNLKLLQIFQSNQLEIDIFLALISAGGREKIDKISEILRMNPIAVQHGLDQLGKSGLTVRGSSNYYLLTDIGRETAVNLGLTSIFS